MNYKYHQNKLSDITKDLIYEVVNASMGTEMTQLAPLGASGETFLLFGESINGRKSVVSIRSYNGDPELLITDKKGSFLFYGRFHANNGTELLAQYYWMIFTTLENLIENDIGKNSVKISPNATLSVGFNIPKCFLK